jgi:hypothetical protein
LLSEKAAWLFESPESFDSKWLHSFQPDLRKIVKKPVRFLRKLRVGAESKPIAKQSGGRFAFEGTRADFAVGLGGSRERAERCDACLRA